MSRLKLVSFALAGGLLLSVSWPATGSLWWISFFAFVPLLWIEEDVTCHAYRSRKVFFSALLFFFVFNLATTWWIWNASEGGMLMAVILNSFFMAVVFRLFHLTRRRAGDAIGYLSLVLYWLAFEHIHYYWELSWPWLNLGNVFATAPQVVQWYELTGLAGGTLWVWGINLCVFFSLRSYVYKEKTNRTRRLSLLGLCALLALPVSWSLWRFSTYTEKENPAHIVVVQPNIDPYNDKFDAMSPAQQLEAFYALARRELTAQTDFLVGPETQLPLSVSENSLEHEPELVSLRAFMKDYPSLQLVTGMSSHRVIHESENTSPSAKPTSVQGLLYEHYNTALWLANGERPGIYHKSKLVLGVEKIPFSGIFPFLEKLALNLGGTSGSLGTQPEPSVFRPSRDSRFVVAPAICYESIYGDYLTGFVRAGANLIFIITNDGWWGDTPGYKQHLAYARLRAIETRRSVARCANTGVSAFINQRGEVLQQTGWWEPAVIRATLNANDTLTFYARFGDYIGRASSFGALVLFAYTLLRIIRRQKVKRR